MLPITFFTPQKVSGVSPNAQRRLPGCLQEAIKRLPRLYQKAPTILSQGTQGSSELLQGFQETSKTCRLPGRSRKLSGFVEGFSKGSKRSRWRYSEFTREYRMYPRGSCRFLGNVNDILKSPGNFQGSQGSSWRRQVPFRRHQAAQESPRIIPGN